MSEQSQKEIKELIEAHGSRLHELEMRLAIRGSSADPSVVIEIRTINSKILELKSRIADIASESRRIMLDTSAEVVGIPSDHPPDERIEKNGDEISKLKKRRLWVSALGWRSFLMGFACILIAVVGSLFIVGYLAPPRVKAKIQIVPPGDESFDVKCRDEIADGYIRVTLNLSRHSRDMLQSHVAEIKPPSGFEITCLTAAYYNPLLRTMSEILVIQEQEFRSLAIGYFRVVVYVKLIPKHGYDIKSYRDEDWTLRIDKQSVQIQEVVDNE